MTQEPVKSTSCPRWVKIALAVSLAGNLLVAGMAGGMIWQGGKSGPPRISDAGGAYTQALTPADRRDIGKVIGQSIRDRQSGRAAVLAEYRGMLEVLRSEPFDRAAAEQVLKRQAQIFEHRRQVSETALLERLESMTPQERAAFVERLEQGVKRSERRMSH